ncbi:MAG: hypothetical protein ACRDWS_14930 [Acidimicrobiia bacterium]
MHRPLPSRLRALILIGALLIAACGEEPAAETAPESTTTIPTTTTSAPAGLPAEVTTIARMPEGESLQDGSWAAIVFHQPLDCIPPDADLGTRPAECETPVIFMTGGSEDVFGREVPVWLVRRPVLDYALANGPSTMERLRSLPTLVETISESYTERPDGRLEITGELPGGGDYAIEVAQTTTTIEIQPEMGGEAVVLSDLTGRWESETHVLQVDEGGSYELFELEADGSTVETGVFGFIALQDGMLIFATSANPGPCPGETGVYFGEMWEEELHLAAVDEPCAFRERAFGSPWSLSSDGSSRPELAISDLSGSWENDSVVLRVNDAGDYVVLASGEAGQEERLMGGFVARDDRQFIFVTGIGGECPGQTGVYQASITDDLLTLTLIEDLCESRSLGFGEPFSMRTD